jgi:hypothetical protein
MNLCVTHKAKKFLTKWGISCYSSRLLSHQFAGSYFCIICKNWNWKIAYYYECLSHTFSCNYDSFTEFLSFGPSTFMIDELPQDSTFSYWRVAAMSEFLRPLLSTLNDYPLTAVTGLLLVGGSDSRLMRLATDNRKPITNPPLYPRTWDNRINMIDAVSQEVTPNMVISGVKWPKTQTNTFYSHGNRTLFWKITHIQNQTIAWIFVRTTHPFVPRI